MKKYLILLIIPFMFACGRAAKKEAAVLKVKYDSLLSQTTQKEMELNGFIHAVNEIQGTLDTIKMKQNVISMSTNKPREMKTSAKEQIKADIASIYDLMQKNKEQLATLNSKLKNTSVKEVELTRLVERLTKDISDKNQEIETLRAKLDKMNIGIAQARVKVDTLTKTVNVQSQKLTDQTQTIAQQDASINTAYYIIGKEKELKKNGILGKGGVILPNFNKDFFTRIDIRKVTEISLMSKKVKVISIHPTESYKLVPGEKKMIQSLQILDYKAFWSNVKYLIITIN